MSELADFGRMIAFGFGFGAGMGLAGLAALVVLEIAKRLVMMTATGDDDG